MIFAKANTLQLMSLGSLLGMIIAALLFKRFSWFKTINYFFASLRYRTKNILLCRYCQGVDYKYEETDFCYLIATDNYIRVHPVFLSWKKTVIPYEAITDFLIILHDDITITAQWPQRIKQTVYYIVIEFNGQSNQKDHLSLEFETPSFTFDSDPFNKYSLRKSNFFEYIAGKLPDGYMRQEINDYDKHYAITK
jgi:hypothetical protein